METKPPVRADLFSDALWPLRPWSLEMLWACVFFLHTEPCAVMMSRAQPPVSRLCPEKMGLPTAFLPTFISLFADHHFLQTADQS